ncbi:sulfatase-like hydrolase/transferase [Natrinema sp. HArc-T2]|uniref:sulfatase n=1 Tax=Natrinema sp. HArc-T2 TaxID=3242701 RepID=UPI00359DB677
MNFPNILFLVWDSARLDYVRQHAPTLESLATDNLWFENAIAPATWSLPSHVSLFAGQYPHEHGVHRVDHQINGLPLLDELHQEDYTCYGVSGNGFASPRIGFDVSFDEFVYTRRQPAFKRGLPVRSAANHLNKEGYSKPEIVRTLLRRVLRHEHPLASAANFINVAGTQLGIKYELLQQCPTGLFDSEPDYDPADNTEALFEILEQHSSGSRPFFAFANYMDCHWPYDPPEEFRDKHVSTALNQSEIDRLNSLTAPWDFIQQVECGDGVREEDLDTVRDLYAAEVESVDEHLKRILSKLEETGLREDTLIVITADHGENLGEIDAMGRQRMGHEASVSENLVRVPLVIAHPALEGKTFDRHVSLTGLYDLFISGTTNQSLENGAVSDALGTEDVILCEYPAVGGEEMAEKYPDIPDCILADRLSTHSVVAYRDDWRVVLDSTGEEWAWQDGEEASVEGAPSTVVSCCRSALNKLETTGDKSEELSDSVVEQLEDLGYM